MSMKELHAIAGRVARSAYMTQYKDPAVDHEDIAQKVMVTALERSGGIRNDQAYVFSVARLIAHKAGYIGSPTDVRARSMLKARVEREEQSAGRSLTRSEYQGQVQQIREKWKDPRRKPSRGYASPHRRVDQRVLEYLSEQTHVRLNEETEWEQKALDLVDQGCTYKARHVALNAIIDMHNRTNQPIPLLTPGSKPTRWCKEAYKTVLNAPDGVPGSVRRYLADVSDESTSMVLELWDSTITVDDKRRIARLLLTHGPYTQLLWVNGLRYVNKLGKSE